MENCSFLAQVFKNVFMGPFFSWGHFWDHGAKIEVELWKAKASFVSNLNPQRANPSFPVLISINFDHSLIWLYWGHCIVKSVGGVTGRFWTSSLLLLHVFIFVLEQPSSYLWLHDPCGWTIRTTYFLLNFPVTVTPTHTLFGLYMWFKDNGYFA